MNERSMQAVLMQYVMETKHHEVCLPNSKMYHWEADLLSITKAWLVHEWEIKLTLADFRADQNKRNKHYWLQLEKRYPFRSPNYFWYVTHGFSPDDLPAYAGWARVEWRAMPQWKTGGLWEVRVEKNAPRLHTSKLSERDRRALLRWLSFKVKRVWESHYMPGAAS